VSALLRLGENSLRVDSTPECGFKVLLDSIERMRKLAQQPFDACPFKIKAVTLSEKMPEPKILFERLRCVPAYHRRPDAFYI
jgi:cytochrome c556